MCGAKTKNIMILKIGNELHINEIFGTKKVSAEIANEELAYILNSAYQRYETIIRAMVEAKWSYASHMDYLGSRKLTSSEIEGFGIYNGILKVLKNARFTKHKGQLVLCEKLHIYHQYRKSEREHYNPRYTSVHFFPQTVASTEMRENVLIGEEFYQRYVGTYQVPIKWECSSHKEIENRHTSFAELCKQFELA